MAETLETIGEKLEALGNGFEALGAKVAALDAKVAALDAKVDKGFASVDARFASIDQRFASIDRRFASIDQRFALVDERFDRLEKAVQDGDEKTRAFLGVKIDDVAGQVKLIFEKVSAVDERLEADSVEAATVQTTLEKHDLRLIALETRRTRRKAR